VLIDEKVLTTAGPSTVICLDARDGSEIWRTANHYFKDVLGEDEVTEATAFCLNASGKLHALNVRNGEVRWARDYTSDFLGKIPTWGFSATPIVCDGTLVVSPGGGAGFVGLNPVNGEDLWEIETEEANYPSLTIRKSQGHNQAIGYDRDSLYGVNAEHGTVLWQLRVKNPRGYIVPQPALVNDKLLLIDQYSGARLHAFDDKGAIQQTPVAANRRLRTDLSTPHVVRNIVLVGAGCLTCADAQKLEVLWEQEDEESFAAEILHIVSHDGQTVVFSQDGHGLVIEADREGCTILAKAKLSEATFARPVFGSDCVYARDGKYLYCYGLKK